MKLLTLLSTILFTTLFTTLPSVPAFAAEPESVRDRVFKFLETNVMDRTQQVKTEGTLTSDGQNYTVNFEATITWSGLKKISEGLVFEERREVKQSNTKVDDKGVAVDAPVRSDRIVVRQYTVTERKTTRSLVGLTTVTQNPTDETAGLGFTTMIEISDDNKEIYLYESLTSFIEMSLDGKNIQPVSTASSATLYLNKDGKLMTDETLKFYKVDVNRDFAREEINRFNLTATELKK